MKNTTESKITLSEEDAVAGMTNRIRLQNVEPTRRDARWADKMRNLVQVHEYLCHIGEAIEWIESFLNEKIDNSENREASIALLEHTLHDGVVLAKLAKKIHPGSIQNIISGDAKFKFLLSNNINAFLSILKYVGLPQIFWFEFVDLYDGKNMPKVIYCIHALSHLLHSNQSAPKIKNMNGEFYFSDELLVATQRSLEKSGATIPNFNNLGSSLQKELAEEGTDKKRTQKANEYESRRFSFMPIENHIDDEELLLPTLHSYSDIPHELTMTELYDSDIESKSSGSISESDNAEIISTIQKFQYLVDTTEESDSSSVSDLDYHDNESILEVEEFYEEHFTQPDNNQVLVHGQGLIRSFMAKSKLQKIKDEHRYQAFQSTISKIQSRIKSDTMDHALGEKRVEYYTYPEEWVIALQAEIRRFLAMKKLDEVYQMTLELHGQFEPRSASDTAYQKLKSEKNPTVAMVKSVLHMLSNNDIDFDQDLILEELRQKVIESIQDNKLLDSQVSALDIQIALLLKNAVTLDEVVKLSNSFFIPNRKKQQQQKFSQLLSSNSSATHHPYDLRGVDKSSKDRLELYQQLVYLLQTKPIYLSQLMSIASGQAKGEKKGQKKFDETVLALFGYGMNTREECLLINLCKACINEEIKRVQNTQEFMRGNYTFMKLIVQVNRGAKEKAFFYTLFRPIINKILEDKDLSLETNPTIIYQRCISMEEVATGSPSKRPFNVDPSEALKQPDVVQILNSNLNNLREVTEGFLDAITQSPDAMPYGMRSIARELKTVLEEHFPNEPSGEIIKLLGHFVFYRYLSPLIIAPEQYDVIHDAISLSQRRNLAEVSKMLQQIASGKPFDSKNSSLNALNTYIQQANIKFTKWFISLTNVVEPEEHFGIDPLADLTNTQKPIIYIHPTDLFHIHGFIEENINYLEQQEDGILHCIMNELGKAPSEKNLYNIPTHLLRLELIDRRENMPTATNGGDIKKLLLDTKRLIVLVIQVQSGPDLETILSNPVTDEHEIAWNRLKEEEFPSEGTEKMVEYANKERNFKFGYQNASMDVKSLTFVQLKSFATKLHGFLMENGVIPRSPGYQSIINMIALDITKKGERRKSRNAEIERLKTIFMHLEEKAEYLKSQGASYKQYLDSSMNHMAEKKGKRQKFVLPFTTQYYHMKHLQKKGCVPKFGSFIYSAKALYDRQIIVDLADVPKKLYSRITIILSMGRANIITFEACFPLLSGQNLHVDVLYEDLLQTQYEGIQTMKVFDGMAKVNVNLLIYLINKKFYHSS
ncbi:hypothetical protein BDB01DRAFT_850417 [Pilobolus umbonatus]|nr:hypothetical protein BDB01DRAFT_850417 [Pilobolus umbonatus]